MSKPTVFHLYPRGTYKSQPFYFRGSDPLFEPEHIKKTYSIIHEQYITLRKQVEKEKSEFAKLCKTLSVRDDYTVALASALGNESITTTENAQLRSTLADLTIQIESAEREIEDYQNKSNTTLLSELIREKAYYYAEMQNSRVSILHGIDEINESKRNMADIVTSSKFSDYFSASSDIHACQRLHSQLRKHMNSIFRETGSRNQTHANPPPDEIKSQILDLYNQVARLQFEKDDLSRQRTYAEIISEEAAHDMLLQIQQMNDVYVSFGGEPLDMQEIVSHLLLPEHQKPSEEEQPSHRPQTSHDRKKPKIVSTRREKPKAN